LIQNGTRSDIHHGRTQVCAAEVTAYK